MLGKPHAVHGLHVRCQPYKVKTSRAQRGNPNFDYEPLAADGEPGVALSRVNKQPVFGPLMKVTAEMRDAAGVMFIDHRRGLRDHHPWARGHPRAAARARAQGARRHQLDDQRTHADEFSARYQAAMDALRTPRVREIEHTISRTARRILGFLGSAALAELDVRFGFADPTNAYGTLRLNYREGGLKLPADDSAPAYRARSWSGSLRHSASPAHTSAPS